MMGMALLFSLLAGGGVPPLAVEVLDEQARPVAGPRYVALVPQSGGPQRPEVEAVVAEGEQAVLAAPPGAYFLICAAEGFLPAGLWRGARLPVELRPGQPVRAVCQLPAAGVADLAAVADVTGQPVQDAHFSLAVMEKLEELSPLAKGFLGKWFSCRTTAQGRCRLYGPLGKRAEVVVSAPAYARLLIPAVEFSHPPAQGPSVRLAPAGTVEVALEGVFPWKAERRPSLTLLPAHLRHLGKVRERTMPQRAPIQKEEVAIFSNVAPGSYVLEAVRDSGEGWEKLDDALGQTVELMASERLRVVVTLVDVEVRGTVKGLPGPAACELEWYGPAGRRVAAELHPLKEAKSFLFTARLGRLGRWRSVIFCELGDDFWTWEGAVMEVKHPQASLEWNLQVPPDPFRGWVVDGKGRPVEGARVSVTHLGPCSGNNDQGTVSCETRSGAGGEFVCPGIGAGLREALVYVASELRGFGPTKVANGSLVTLTPWRRLKVEVVSFAGADGSLWRASFSCKEAPFLLVGRNSGDASGALEVFAPRCAGTLLLWRPQQEEHFGLFEVPAGGDQTFTFAPEQGGVSVLPAGQAAQLAQACPDGTVYLEGPWGHWFRMELFGAYAYPFAPGPKVLPFLPPGTKWKLVVAARGCEPCARIALPPALAVDDAAMVLLP